MYVPNTYVCTCIHAHMHSCSTTHIRVHICNKHMHTYVHTTHIRMCTCTYIRLYVHTYIHVLTYVRMYTHAPIRMYIQYVPVRNKHMQTGNVQPHNLFLCTHVSAPKGIDHGCMHCMSLWPLLPQFLPPSAPSPSAHFSLSPFLPQPLPPSVHPHRSTSFPLMLAELQQLSRDSSDAPQL